MRSATSTPPSNWRPASRSCPWSGGSATRTPGSRCGSTRTSCPAPVRAAPPPSTRSSRSPADRQKPGPGPVPPNPFLARIHAGQTGIGGSSAQMSRKRPANAVTCDVWPSQGIDLHERPFGCFTLVLADAAGSPRKVPEGTPTGRSHSFGSAQGIRVRPVALDADVHATGMFRRVRHGSPSAPPVPSAAPSSGLPSGPARAAR